MMHINVNDVNEALREGFHYLKVAGIKEESRNGPVLVAPGPVLTTYRTPERRVLFNSRRDANPTFHLMECFWMMAGSNHVGWLEQFNARMREYAEENGLIHGAYGARWRAQLGIDQIPVIIDILRNDPESRRAVLSMWSAEWDIGVDAKDVPCNTHAYFDCRGGKLNMTVCCRSNDMLWGAYGANAVHFSFLQEVIAWGVGLPMGEYRQFSNNFHVYLNNEMVEQFLASPPLETDRPARVITVPLLQGDETVADLIMDAVDMVRDGRASRTHFATNVAMPMMRAYLARKEGLSYHVHMLAMADSDWKLALQQWIFRREV